MHLNQNCIDFYVVGDVVVEDCVFGESTLLLNWVSHCFVYMICFGVWFLFWALMGFSRVYGFRVSVMSSMWKFTGKCSSVGLKL